MEAKCYRAMQRAQGKMLREYFSGVSVESLSRRYGYSVIKIKTMASDYKQGKIDIFDDCIVSVGTELVIWLYRIHVRSYNLAASAEIAVSFVSILICS